MRVCTEFICLRDCEYGYGTSGSVKGEEFLDHIIRQYTMPTASLNRLNINKSVYQSIVQRNRKGEKEFFH
jgi:hypothetical protein